MSLSKISWTDETWNPLVGCTKVSAGCKNCYASTLHEKRHKAWKTGNFPTAPVQYHEPFSTVQLKFERLEMPLHWRKPRLVFVNSVSDLFHEMVPDEFIARVWQVMSVCPKHTFQVLTKRPERMAEWTRRWADHRSEPGVPDWIWLGTSVENQMAADERIPHLLRCPAAVRFLSCEPLLGPLTLDDIRPRRNDGSELCSVDALRATRHLFVEDDWSRNRVNWVIAGGESGPGYRPLNLDWVRSLRDQALGAGVAFFFKQSSGLRPETNTLLDGFEWRQFPETEDA